MILILHIKARFDGDEEDLARVMDSLDDGEFDVEGVELHVTDPVGVERIV